MVGKPLCSSLAVGFSYIDTGYPCKLIVLEYLRLHISAFTRLGICYERAHDEMLLTNSLMVRFNWELTRCREITKLQDLVRHTQFCVMFVVDF